MRGLKEVISNTGIYNLAYDWVLYRSWFSDVQIAPRLGGQVVPKEIGTRLHSAQLQTNEVQSLAFLAAPFPGTTIISYYEARSTEGRLKKCRTYEVLRAKDPGGPPDIFKGRSLNPTRIRTYGNLRNVLYQLQVDQTDQLLDGAARSTARYILDTPAMLDLATKAYIEQVAALIELGGISVLMSEKAIPTVKVGNKKDQWAQVYDVGTWLKRNVGVVIPAFSVA